MIEDIRFVLSECARIQNVILNGGVKGIARDDIWFSVPHIHPPGQMLCGRAAAQRLEGLAIEAGRRAGLASRVKVETLRSAMGEVVVQRFLREERPIDAKQVDRALSSVAKLARKSCSDTTHFLPCHLMLAKDPDEIVIGPVIFRNRKAFRRVLFEYIAEYRKEKKTDERRWSRKLLFQALKYYRTFHWVAEVRIEGCDKKTSEYLANRAITSALDCLHLVLGARWTDRMRVGGPAIRRDRRAALTVSASGQLGVSVTMGGMGQVNFQDGWSERLTREDYKRPLELCAVALEAAVNPDLDRPLSRRFLDAAQWFGEASRDSSYSTQVVKYVTALERMVMTEEKDDITSLVSERVAALCFDIPSAEDRNRWRQRARSAYDLRSQLVHGAMSPAAPEVARGVETSAELGEATLLCAINAFGEQGLRQGKISSKGLGRWFGHMVAWADKITAPGSMLVSEGTGD